MNAVAAVDLGVDEFKGGDAGFEGCVLESAVAFFFGEEIAPVGDDESRGRGCRPGRRGENRLR